MEREGGTGLRKVSEACWAQARANYAASITLLDAGVYFASVFFAQQAAEQALKAAHIQKLQKIARLRRHLDSLSVGQDMEAFLMALRKHKSNASFLAALP